MMPHTRAPRTAAYFWIVAAAALAAGGCAALKDAQPSWPVKEYEKIIAGRLDADYVGTATCVSKCHTHDVLTRDFRLSIHGEQVSAKTGLPLVNCESCHGPGSLAIANIKDGRCDSSTFIPLAAIPRGALSLICLKCHSGQSLSNLSDWPGSPHAMGNVACPDCHKIHRGPAQKVARREIAPLCVSCHRSVAVTFNLPSHHPVQEGKMTCVDCHDPHGTTNGRNLKASPSRNGCARCHAEKTGPFVYEHASLTVDCENCHDPHGSVNGQLLRQSEPFLCLQCHNGHNSGRHPGLANAGTKAVFFTNCTACHPRIHGTDRPGDRVEDRLTR
jgi:DmsE family decaheme c-type cytochrome